VQARDDEDDGHPPHPSHDLPVRLGTDTDVVSSVGRARMEASLQCISPKLAAADRVSRSGGPGYSHSLNQAWERWARPRGLMPLSSNACPKMRLTAVRDYIAGFPAGIC